MKNGYISGFVQGFAAGWSGLYKDRCSFRTNDEKSNDNPTLIRVLRYCLQALFEELKEKAIEAHEEWERSNQ